MFRILSLLPTLALTAGMALTTGAALAQEAATPAAPAEPAPAADQAPAAAPAQMDAGMAYESARNQLGILKYCQEQGHNDGKAVEVQQKLMAMIPAGDVAKGDAAEAKGAAGTVSAMGNELSLADAAEQQQSSIEALCKQMDAMIQQLGAQLPG